jgi:ABC-type spermidine/putrescine transport system permease subunit II
VKIGLILAVVLGIWVAVLLWRGDRSSRVGVVAAVGFGVLIPQVLAAVADATGSVSAMLSTAGW